MTPPQLHTVHGMKSRLVNIKPRTIHYRKKQNHTCRINTEKKKNTGAVLENGKEQMLLERYEKAPSVIQTAVEPFIRKLLRHDHESDAIEGS